MESLEFLRASLSQAQVSRELIIWFLLLCVLRPLRNAYETANGPLSDPLDLCLFLLPWLEI
uniref:Uncharacterized protein n=1 Tax=Arundo donax TaxID=35708 RepID=A0A0A9JNB8_ARUDO